MRVYLSPTGLFSHAMTRVANALTRYAPKDITITPTLGAADLHILHVINADAIPYAQDLINKGKKIAIIQYCYKTAGGEFNDWWETWRESALIWSYYNLTIESQEIGFNFYHAPLGIDDVFIGDSLHPSLLREPLVLTSGYVTGPGAEAIEEVWIAAKRSGLKALHIGPSKVEGFKSYPHDWSTVQPSDQDLAQLYRRAQWVSSLRYIEGFELPAAEGLANGTRSILFDQPDLRHWYRDHTVYVPECSGQELIDSLYEVFSTPTIPVSTYEHTQILSRFNWRTIAQGFWKELMKGID